MNERSTYHVDCECGREIVSFEKITSCAHCGRLIILEWGNAPVVLKDATAEAEPPKKARGASA